MSDKRSVHTDALQTLGMILKEEQGARDAIHLAVEPCVAGEQLYPGQHIGLFRGKAMTNTIKKLGIVDPFIRGYVPEGGRFWMIIYPRTITSLRHVWEHPDFAEEKSASNMTKAASEEWLRNFCKTADCPEYDELIELMMNGTDRDGYSHCRIDEEYLHFGGTDAHGSIPPEFWNHIEIVTGREMHVRPDSFSCSC